MIRITIFFALISLTLIPACGDGDDAGSDASGDAIGGMCGATTCGAREVCCTDCDGVQSCGMACSGIACPPIDSGVTCGAMTCAPSQVCCTDCDGNQSCGDACSGMACLDAGADADATTDAATPDACAPLNSDPSAIGRDCSDGSSCPDGYTCQGFSGGVFAQSCQILCEMDCQCPTGIPGTCVEVTDKAGTWMQCELPKI